MFELSKDSLLLLLAFGGMWFGFWNVIGPVQFGVPNILNTNQAFILFILTFPALVAFIFCDLFKYQKGKWICLVSLISLLVIIPTTLSMADRLGPGQAAFYVHDNPIQMEEAVKFLLNGQNPYGKSYFTTVMKDYGYHPWFYDLKGEAPIPAAYLINPALFHLVSLPFGFVVMIPFYLLFNSFFGFFDARIVYLLAYLGSLGLGNLLVEKKDRLNFTTLFALNPLLAPFIIEGRNDILTVFLLLLTLVLWTRKRLFFSAVCLGLAIASKQSAWIFGAVFFIYLFLKMGKRRIEQFMFQMIVAGLVSLVIFAPFFIWNPVAFMNDIFKYINGGTQFTYPIKGYGFSMLLLNMGFLENSISSYPATVLQILFGLPALSLVIYMLKKQPTLKIMVIGFSLVLLTFLFFARFFLDNYFGVVVAFLILGYFLQSSDRVVE